MSKDKPKNMQTMFDCGGLKIITPTYSIELIGGNFVIVEASSNKVDTENGIVTFQSGDLINAMFRLEDVKEFRRIY